MEGRPAADGTSVLWTEDGRWFVDHSERGSIGTEYAYVFGSEAEACRWVYDRAYLSRYETAGSVYLRYLDEIGDQETATAVRRHQSAIQALSKGLAEHHHNQPPQSDA